eukprot:scaffold210942_cov30-Tisochrysis_lutea.AAC.2
MVARPAPVFIHHVVLFAHTTLLHQQGGVVAGVPLKAYEEAVMLLSLSLKNLKILATACVTTDLMIGLAK